MSCRDVGVDFRALVCCHPVLHRTVAPCNKPISYHSNQTEALRLRTTSSGRKDRHGRGTGWCFGFEAFNKVMKAGAQLSNFRCPALSVMKYWSLRSARVLDKL